MSKKQNKRSLVEEASSVAEETVSDDIVYEEGGDGSIDLVVVSPRINDKEAAIEKAGFNLKDWQIAKARVKSYEMGMKVEAMQGKVKVTKAAAVVPLFAVSVELKPRQGWDVEEFRAMLLEDMKRAAPKRRIRKPKVSDNEERLAEISIFDPHIGKLAWHQEVREDYDVDIARDRYMTCFDQLLDDVSSFRPDRYLYVIGNDMLHVDRGTNVTTRNTPQDCDGRWQRSYLYAIQMITDCVCRLREHAPVDVMVVPGNHDEERMFCIGTTIEARFFNDEFVNVMNDPALQKVYKWGEVLLGFEHGDKVSSKKRLEQLPLTFATRYKKEWADSVWREIHLGHLHTEKSYVWQISDTYGDTIVRHLPSISGTDKWHYESAYMSPPACEAHLYSKRCRKGYFSSSPLEVPQ